jgi:hypothetical protein
MIEETYIKRQAFEPPHDKHIGKLVKVHKLSNGTLVQETLGMKTKLKVISLAEFEKMISI